MGFRSNILLLLAVFNFLPLLALYRAVVAWIESGSRRWKVLASLALLLFLINIPISLFWFRWSSGGVFNLPSSTLRMIFYPAAAWQATALLFTVFLGPLYILWAAGKAASKLLPRREPPFDVVPAQGSPWISRRKFLTGGAGLLVPAIYGLSGYKVLSDLDGVDVSPERVIPLPYLPRSFDGMTIAHLSDLHVGPYIRLKEVQHWVSLTNELRPDLVVLTGDLLDRSLTSLPETIQALKELRPNLAVIASLGNHDLTSDPYSSRGEFVGGENVAQALESIGIRTLRNEVTYLNSGRDRLAVMGLDWVLSSGRPGSAGPRGSSFYGYHPAETREILGRMTARLPPETPTVLLAHHPDTFGEVPPFRIGLTLSGHTHGGGQVVFFRRGGEPVGISSARFKYVSGLYQQDDCRLYVNRGLGYFGVPVRINCPPEISRFRLVSSPSTS